MQDATGQAQSEGLPTGTPSATSAVPLNESPPETAQPGQTVLGAAGSIQASTNAGLEAVVQAAIASGEPCVILVPDATSAHAAKVLLNAAAGDVHREVRLKAGLGAPAVWRRIAS